MQPNFLELATWTLDSAVSTAIQTKLRTLDFSSGPSFLSMIKDYLLHLIGIEFNTRYRRYNWSYSKI